MRFSYILLITVTLSMQPKSVWAQDTTPDGTPNPALSTTADSKEIVIEDVDAGLSTNELRKLINQCANDKNCDGDRLATLRGMLADKEKEKPVLDCQGIDAGKRACQSAKGFAAASGTVTQLTSAYSQASAARALQGVSSQYSGGMNTAQIEQDGLRQAGIEAQQAANRQKVIAGIGLSIAATNFAVAARMKDGATKATNNQAGIAALAATMTPAMLAMQDQQNANQFRAQEEALAKYLASLKGTKTTTQNTNLPVLDPLNQPIPQPTNPAGNAYDPNLMGTGVAMQPVGEPAPVGGDLAWNGGSGLGSGGGGGGMGGFGGGLGGGSHGGSPGNPTPYIPPMDPNAGRPTMANVDESGAGYRGGMNRGTDPNKLDMNSMLAQFLPKEGDKIGNMNGVMKNDANSRAIASESISLLDANVNIFNRISDIYSQKAKEGLIQL